MVFIFYGILDNVGLYSLKYYPQAMYVWSHLILHMDKKCKNWFVRLIAKILNKYLKTLKICKSGRRSLVSKVKVFVKNANNSHYRNVLDLAKSSMYISTMLLELLFMKVISYKWNWRHDFLLICGVQNHSLTKSIMISLLSILKPIGYFTIKKSGI